MSYFRFQAAKLRQVGLSFRVDGTPVHPLLCWDIEPAMGRVAHEAARECAKTKGRVLRQHGRAEVLAVYHHPDA